ncbi:MAG: hypothetical protein BWY64_04048 [bacterium ADurb.Bin363]|nr:MAG: hypothetical protein BWY64_04048 [bacterium ADurb.Bin363]
MKDFNLIFHEKDDLYSFLGRGITYRDRGRVDIPLEDIEI